MDIEQRLRESLSARANDVTPDPETFALVQQRIRRTRVMRMAAAGGVAVAGVAVLALVLPGLNGQRVEFEPAPPVATAPPEEPTPDAAVPEAQTDLPEAGGVAFSEGGAVYAMALDGESAEQVYDPRPGASCPAPRCDYLTDLALAPWSTLGDAAGLARTVIDCGSLDSFADRSLPGIEEQPPITITGCATSVAFISGGEGGGSEGAWIEKGENGDWILSALSWSDTGVIPSSDSVTTWTVTDQYDDMILEDVVLGQPSGDGTTGYAVVTARTPDGYDAFRLPMERQGDGALAVTGELEPYGYFEGYRTVAFDDAGARPGPGRPHYAIEVLEDESDGTFTDVRLVRLIDGERAGAVDLALELLEDGEEPFDPADLWIASLGDTVLYGNADQGRAFTERWDGDGFVERYGLEATIVAGDLMAMSAPAPEPSEPPATTEVDVFFADQDTDCVSDRPVTREVQTPGVARGALNALLAGPNPQEQNEAIVSPFTAATAGALLDVTVSDGVAVVDLMHLGEWLDASTCTRGLVDSAIERTLLQFETVDRVRITFDGNASLYRDWKNGGDPADSESDPVQPPDAVLATAEQIRNAAAASNYDALATLIDPESFVCSFDDSRNQDCIGLWNEQEEQGLDPLGVLSEILAGDPAMVPDSAIWAWPTDHVETPDYLGPRTGIDEDGVWRYYQPGGD